MPVQDIYWDRVIPIESVAVEPLTCLPYADRLTLVYLTSGKANILFNGIVRTLKAPCILLFYQDDTLKLLDSHQLEAQSFSFHPAFLSPRISFESLIRNEFYDVDDLHDRDLLETFLQINECYNGVIHLPAYGYRKLGEWLEKIATEMAVKSDHMWTCRIRRYLLHILYLIDENRGEEEHVQTDVDVVLEYIHTNYQLTILLEDLCKLTNTNRTTLNKKFKQQLGTTIANYLLNFRIKLACDMLWHTGLTINEISKACGFNYESYFIRQFKQIMGTSPTQYRQNVYEFRNKRREREKK